MKCYRLHEKAEYHLTGFYKHYPLLRKPRRVLNLDWDSHFQCLGSQNLEVSWLTHRMKKLRINCHFPVAQAFISNQDFPAGGTRLPYSIQSLRALLDLPSLSASSYTLHMGPSTATWGPLRIWVNREHGILGKESQQDSTRIISSNPWDAEGPTLGANQSLHGSLGM